MSTSADTVPITIVAEFEADLRSVMRKYDPQVISQAVLAFLDRCPASVPEELSESRTAEDKPTLIAFILCSSCLVLMTLSLFLDGDGVLAYVMQSLP